MDYNISLKGGGAAVGAAAGLASSGPTAMVVGAGLGYLVANYSIKSARSAEEGTSIHVSRNETHEMGLALDLAVVGIWAVRPLILADDYIGNELRRRIYDQIVDPYSNTVTPYVHDIMEYTRTMANSACLPENAFRRVRKQYGRRLGRKDQPELHGLAFIVVGAMREYGNIEEQREWFWTWCRKLGIEAAAARIWNDAFHDLEPETMGQFLRRRHEMAMDMYEAGDA